MLILKKLTYKNFLSTGKIETTININECNITLVTGNNGCGKSTIISALYFVLYGKTFSKVNKEGLINSLNKKELLVTLEMEQNGIKYLIKRGMKPSVFEIYINNVLKPVPANIKDYQHWLETQVIKMDEKTFRQTAIIGSTSYIPFMRLSALDRRTVIEDILDIDVFSSMNTIAKSAHSKLKPQVDSINGVITGLKYKIEAEQKAKLSVTDNLNETYKNYETRLKSKTQELKKEIDIVTDLGQKLNDIQIKDITKLVNEIMSKKEEYSNDMHIQKNGLDTSKKHIKFFSENDVCPMCKSELSQETRDKKIEEFQVLSNEQSNKLQNINTELKSLLEEYKKCEKSINEYKEIKNSINNHTTLMSSLKNDITVLKKEKDNIDKKMKTVTEESNTEELYREELVQKEKELEKIQNDINAYETVIDLLKDSGIKSIIIKQYITTINVLIKKYLKLMDYNVSFTFEENFNETIKVRGKEEMSYESFSEGERFRFDMAILFAFREISKLRNSNDCNLLFMDEKDGVLDTDSINILELLFRNVKGNVFFVTHNPESYRDFMDRELHFEKINNFSKLMV